MWFPNKNFLLTTEFNHSTADTIVEVYDQNFNRIDYNDCCLQVNLPNMVIFRLMNVNQSEITRMSLAGINFNRDSLIDIVEYKICKYKLQSLQELKKFQSQKTLTCNKDGYFVTNFFNRNPFAIHLGVANKINFKL